MTRDWVQQAVATVTYFARNARGDFVVGSAGANVVDGVRRTATRVPLHGAVADAAFDTNRNVLYLSQPDSGRIMLFSLATNTFGAPILIAGRPTGLDLSVSGDSLLVALRSAVARVVSAPFTGRLLLTPSGDRLISITDSELVLANLP